MHDLPPRNDQHVARSVLYLPVQSVVELFYHESKWAISHSRAISARRGSSRPPIAMAMIMNNLSQVYTGSAATGPLLQSTAREMVSRPLSRRPGDRPSRPQNCFWFVLCLDVYPKPGPGEPWEKFGSLVGTSAFVDRYPNGTVIAAEFSSRLSGDQNGSASSRKQIVSAAPHASASDKPTAVNAPRASVSIASRPIAGSFPRMKAG